MSSKFDHVLPTIGPELLITGLHSGFDQVMSAPQVAGGKGVVGEPTPPPAGKTGVEIKVALFFDGTMNNRTNTEARIARHDNLLDKDKKNELSSYANFYSNVAVLEYMNARQNPNKHEVSVYVEGIGTVNFSEDDSRSGKVADADNGNDERQGYAFGSGFTGIVDRVTKGILEAKAKIPDAYASQEEYIEKITIDVVGFSRGAAAARHFVFRHFQLQGPWLGQGRPELVVNFVGLFETVSSFEQGGKTLGGVLVNGIKQKITGIFHNDVAELNLAMGAVPKRVVHLTAQDEFRANFSLTTIDSSLRAGVGFEVALPGVHSDIGGGYAEPCPTNPTRELNHELRHLTGPDEQRYLVEQGWYTDGTGGTPYQFVPADQHDYTRHQNHENHRAAVAQANGHAYQPRPYTGRMHGERFLTNEYQYLTLYLMLGLGQQTIGSGNHEKMAFESLGMEDNVRYQVPADLLPLRNHFAAYVDANAGHTERLVADCPTWADTKWLRNKYLHRSARLFSEGTVIWIAYKRAKHDTRVVISDADNVVKAHPVEIPDLVTVLVA